MLTIPLLFLGFGTLSAWVVSLLFQVYVCICRDVHVYMHVWEHGCASACGSLRLTSESFWMVPHLLHLGRISLLSTELVIVASLASPLALGNLCLLLETYHCRQATTHTQHHTHPTPGSTHICTASITHTWDLQSSTTHTQHHTHLESQGPTYPASCTPHPHVASEMLAA